MTDLMSPDADAIAVVGLAGRFPGAPDVEALARALQSGADLTGELVPDLDTFPAEHFGISLSDAALIDPQHRIFLEESWHAIEHWGHRPTEQPGTVGVFAACSANQYLLHRILPTTRRLPEHHGADYLPLRAAYHLGLRGPAVATQAACAGGLVAVAQAAQSLLDYRCDVALAGAANVTLPEHEYDPATVSPDGLTNSFAADGKGAGFASGAAVLVLRRLDDALADGDALHAVLRGWAVTNDGGRGAGFGAPAADGQVDAVTEAMAVAGFGADRIDAVEGHGSGTALGDAIEISALAAALRDTRPRGLTCLKATTGHLDTASGPASVIKAVLMVRDGYVPVQPRFVDPAESLTGTPFVVPTAGHRLPAPQVVGVSSFGVGGANAHVLVERSPEQRPGRVPLPASAWARERAWIGDAP